MCRLVRRISDESELERAAVEARVDCARAAAARRINNQPLLSKIALNDQSAEVRAAAIEHLGDEGQILAQIALNDKSADVRATAIHHLSDQAELLRVLRESTYWPDRKLAFGQLNQLSLVTLLDSAQDTALRIASEVRLGESDWATVFSEAQKSGDLGDALGAVALVDRQAGLEPAVTAAAHHDIAPADPSRIPELKELLTLYGDVALAEDYLNCGQSDLSDAAGAWAKAHGYEVRIGNGSHRLLWGGAR